MFVIGQFLRLLNCRDQAALVLLKIDVDEYRVCIIMRVCIQFHWKSEHVDTSILTTLFPLLKTEQH